MGPSRFGSRVRLGTNRLTAEEFDQFLVRLDEDREAAATKYQLLRRKLMEVFEHRVSHSAEDLADETIDRIARKLGTEEIHDIRLFAHGVALKLCLEIHKETARFSGLEEHAGGHERLTREPDPEGRIIQELGSARELQCLQRCLAKLPGEDRDLILQYYQGEKQTRILNRQELAKKHGIGIEALRNQTNALRDKLRNCVTRCLTATAWRASI